MKKLVVVMLALAALFLVGCSTTTPLAATSNPLGTRVGEAEVGYLFAWLPVTFNADLGIQKAAKNGGITKISTVDEYFVNYFGVWAIRKTIVTGE